VTRPENTEGKGFRRRPKMLDYLGTGGMEESEAREHAEGLVRRARHERHAGGAGREVEGEAPDPGAVRERREARQRAQQRSRDT
jgi:hypothetical protein